MRDFAKVSPAVWRSKKFKSLPSMEARFIYLYLLTNPHGNSAGCFDLHPQYASADMNMEIERYLYCLDTVSEAGLIEFDKEENTVLITNWIEFNAPANPKHALGILSQLEQASSARLKQKAFQELRVEIIARKFDQDKAVRNALSAFLIPYGDGIATETRDQDQTKTESKTRPEGDLDAREIPRAPLIAVAALTGDGSAALGGGEPELPDIPHHLLRTNLMRKSA